MNLQDFFADTVLCWLATANKKGEPNVSPKEMFLIFDEEELMIANIASPKSIMNIKENPYVCVSGVNIWTQKGIQCKGEAQIISPQQKEFRDFEALFRHSNKGRFRIQHIIRIKVTQKKQILAPSYLFYPNTTEKEQKQASRKMYLPN